MSSRLRTSDCGLCKAYCLGDPEYEHPDTRPYKQLPTSDSVAQKCSRQGTYQIPYLQNSIDEQLDSSICDSYRIKNGV